MFNVIIVVFMVETMSTLVVFFYVLAVLCQKQLLYNDGILFVYIWIFLT